MKNYLRFIHVMTLAAFATNHAGAAWSIVGDINNPAYEGGPIFGELAGRGSVSYQFRISTLEVTSAEWLEFINTFAPQSSTPSTFLRPSFSGFAPVPGAPGTYELSDSINNAGMVPVLGISWREAAMYVNWLHNDQSSDWAAIMNGSYDVSTFHTNPDGSFTDQIGHSPAARYWIPTLDEWIKAVHYDPNKNGPGDGGWWLFPNGSDNPLVPGPPGMGDTSAGEFDFNGPHEFIPLGSYPHVLTPWGLFDASGGAAEWVEEVYYDNSLPMGRGLDGSWAGASNLSLDLDYVYSVNNFPPASSGGLAGLRIAGEVPAPPTLAVITLVYFNRNATRKRKP